MFTFFFWSKILGYLVKPIVIICVFMVLSWSVKKQLWKKRLFHIGTILLLVFSNEFLLNEIMRIWEVKATPFDELQKKYEYGIMLTGFTKSDVGPNDRMYINTGADRITHTLQLYKMGYIKNIFISGGNGRLGENGDETQAIFSFIQLMGVPSENILIENKSRTTYESAIEAKRMLEEKTTADKCLLITSAYHMRRALACFSKAGWSLDSFSTDFLSHHRKFTLDMLIPNVDTLQAWTYLLKEWIGIVAYRIAGFA